MIRRRKPGAPVRGRSRPEDTRRKANQKRGEPNAVEHLEKLAYAKGKWELLDTNFHELRGIERSGERLDEVDLRFIERGQKSCLSINMSIACKKSDGRTYAHEVTKLWELGSNGPSNDQSMRMWQMKNGLSIRLVSGNSWFIFHNTQMEIPEGSWMLGPIQDRS